MQRSLPLYLAILLAIVSCAAGAIIGSAHSLAVVDLIGFFGAVIGAIITILGAYAVFHLQNRATDRRQLGTITGKTVVPHFIVKPEILGGVIARIGDTVMDGSLARRLDALRGRMLGRAI